MSLGTTKIGGDRRFRNDYSLDELKKKFDNENRKLKLF
jgi:hypothetical protein